MDFPLIWWFAGWLLGVWILWIMLGRRGPYACWLALLLFPCVTRAQQSTEFPTATVVYNSNSLMAGDLTFTTGGTTYADYWATSYTAGAALSNPGTTATQSLFIPLMDFDSYFVGRAYVYRGYQVGEDERGNSGYVRTDAALITLIVPKDESYVTLWTPEGDFEIYRKESSYPAIYYLAGDGTAFRHPALVHRDFPDQALGQVSVSAYGLWGGPVPTTLPTPTSQPSNSEWIRGNADRQATLLGEIQETDWETPEAFNWLTTVFEGSNNDVPEDAAVATKISNSVAYFADHALGTETFASGSGYDYFNGSAPAGAPGEEMLTASGGFVGILQVLIAKYLGIKLAFPSLFSIIRDLMTGLIVWNTLLNLVDGAAWAIGWNRPGVLDWMRLDWESEQTLMDRWRKA